MEVNGHVLCKKWVRIEKDKDLKLGLFFGGNSILFYFFMKFFTSL